MKLKDYYKILNVSRYATVDEIESAYCNQKGDKIIGSSWTEEVRRDALLLEARDVLVNAHSRLMHDLSTKNEELTQLVNQKDKEYRKLLEACNKIKAELDDKLKKEEAFENKLQKEYSLLETKLKTEKEGSLELEGSLDSISFKIDVITKELDSYKEKYNSKSGEVLKMQVECDRIAERKDFYKHQNDRLINLYSSFRNHMYRIMTAIILCALFIIVVLIINK